MSSNPDQKKAKPLKSRLWSTWIDSMTHGSGGHWTPLGGLHPPPAVPSRDVLRLVGSIDRTDLEAMSKAIEDGSPNMSFLKRSDEEFAAEVNNKEVPRCARVTA